MEHNYNDEDMTKYSSQYGLYPYTRSEECSWQPEHVSNKLSELLSTDNNSNNNRNTNNSNNNTSNTLSTLQKLHERESANHNLMNQGWTTHQAKYLQSLFGSNLVTNDDDDDENNNSNDTIKNRCASFIRKLIKTKLPPFVYPILSTFLSQFQEPLNIMLLLSAAISLLLHQTTDAISIGLALTIVSGVAAIQEYRSEVALEKLNDLVPHTCTIMRDGKLRDYYPAKDLVVGDLVMLSTGDRIPADCRLVEAIELSVDESSLTGENTSILKTAKALPIFTNNSNPTSAASSSSSSAPPITDQKNIIFMGTLICSGRGRALVVSIGQSTEFGKISSSLSQIETKKSPLQIKIDELGKLLAYGSSIIIAIIAFLGYLAGRPFLETVTVAVSLAVAAIPEGLPICVTVTLALGVLSMANNNAIVKKLTSVETLGCATVVASDKTGTLTQNEMTVRSIYTLAFPMVSFGLTGVGYEYEATTEITTASEMTTAGAEVEVCDYLARSPNIDNMNMHMDTTSETESHQVESATSVPVTKTCTEFNAIDVLFSVACLCNNATVSCTTTTNTTKSESKMKSLLKLSSTISNTNSSGSNSNNNDNKKEWIVSGQPTELALLVGAAKSNVTDPRPQYVRVQEIPFTSERKRMEVKARPVNGRHSCQAFQYAYGMGDGNSGNSDGSLYFVKGMPESILGDCKTHVAPMTSSTSTTSTTKLLTDKGRKRVLSQSRRMASSGLRVLAMAYGTNLDNLTFAGLVGMEDPPRKNVAASVKQLQDGGVSVVMVTGDAKETAIAIAKRCGIIKPPSQNGYGLSFDEDSDDSGSGSGVVGLSVGSGADSGSSSKRSMLLGPLSHNPFDDLEVGAGIALSGEQLDAIPPARLAESIIGIKVFYRVAPRHKLALVRAYQSQGEIVAMTGDGVNDAIALKAADIGVAMGKSGTDVAKEAADVVLADDDFSTIVKAVAGGKGIFFNIRNFLAFQLSTSFAALGMECVATLLGLPNPLNAMQILWINIIMDGPPAQSLGVEPVDEKILNAKPRKANDPILTKPLLLRAVSSAILILFLTLRVFSMEMGDDGVVSRRDTTMTFMTFVNCDLWNAYVCRSADRCFYEMDPFGNITFLWAIGGSILGQLAVIYFKPLQEVFQTEALSLSDIGYILLVSSSVLMLDTLRKKQFSRWFVDSSSNQVFSRKKKDSMLYDEEPKQLFKDQNGHGGNRRSQSTIRSRIPISI